MISVLLHRNAFEYFSLSRFIKSELQKLHQVHFERLGIAGILAASIVSRQEILRINWKYRGGRLKCSDILSFPSASSASDHEKARKEQYLNAKIHGKSVPIQFGHLIICPDFISRRLQRQNDDQMLRRRISKLLVHGFAHLCHLDHYKLEEYKIMQRFEDHLIRETMTRS